jgi:uncharacterized protein
MELISDHGRRISTDDLNTAQLLAHASKQAARRGFDDVLIADVDAHHYESEHMHDILLFLENDVQRQLALSSGGKGDRGGILQPQVGYQDMGGRVTRYVLRASEKTGPGKFRDVQLGRRSMDAMGVDYSCLFPTGMLTVAAHPQREVEVDLCWAYNRWMTEKVLPDSDGRFFSMLNLPLADPEASLRIVEHFAGRKGVTGFMVTSARQIAVHDNKLMKVYRAIEERGLALGFHSGVNWREPLFRNFDRFVSVHALSFSFYNIVHCTNWVLNGMNERFPKLPVIWIESGLAWIPYLMQRLDHEYRLRSSECPLLKRKPSEYMREMYYSSQPLEVEDMGALETTFRMIGAETQLLWSSDYPHWDFDLPAVVWDLPFLSERGKHNIVGGNAARLFKLEPRNAKQRANLARFGNLAS